MVTVCWAVKGGSGTTVVAAALALGASRPSLLVDLDGEMPAALGIPVPDRPGVGDWLASEADDDHLGDLVVLLAPQACLLPWRSSVRSSVGGDLRPEAGPPIGDERWHRFGRWLTDWERRHDGDVTVDAGTAVPDARLLEHATRSLLVTRSCYLSLSRVGRLAVRPTGVIVVDEPGRALSRRDIEHAIGAPVEATVSYDPAVARAVDAGLLESRLPRVLTRRLRGAA